MGYKIAAKLVMTRFSPEFQSILEKYQRQKENTYKILEILGTDYVFNNYGSDEYNESYRKLLHCGTQLYFAKEREADSGKNIYHLTAANFCRQRLCPMCQFRKSERMFVQMFEVVKSLEDDYRFLHLVLTIPNCDGGVELVNGIKKLYKGFGKFIAYKNIERAFKGILRCLEISYNFDDDTFHPHLHCLIAVRPSYFNNSKVYLSYDKLRELWSKAIGSEQLLQIYVRACKVGDYAGVAEVCKYSLKPFDLDKSEQEYQSARMLLTLWHTLKGTRFVQKYGVIRSTFNRLFSADEDMETDISDCDNLDDVPDIKQRKMRYIYWDDITMRYKGDLSDEN